MFTTIYVSTANDTAIHTDQEVLVICYKKKKAFISKNDTYPHQAIHFSRP